MVITRRRAVTGAMAGPGTIPGDARPQRSLFDEVLGKTYDARLVLRLLAYVRPYWFLVCPALLFLAG